MHKKLRRKAQLSLFIQETMWYNTVCCNMPSGGVGVSRESKLKSQEDPEPANIHECLTRITKSFDYDAAGWDIYSIKCPGEKQPYDEWMRTWLIKCIKECFKDDPVKMDIMLAHFALLPGFTLHMPIKDRLMKYVEISGYLARYPSDSRRPLDEIRNDPDEDRKKDELAAIEKKITRMQRDLVEQLAQYIEKLTSPAEHIADLKEYGELKIIKGKKVYRPFPIKLNVPRLDTPPSADNVHDPIIEKHSQELSTDSDKKCKENSPALDAKKTKKLDSGGEATGHKNLQGENENEPPVGSRHCGAEKDGNGQNDKPQNNSTTQEQCKESPINKILQKFSFIRDFFAKFLAFFDTHSKGIIAISVVSIAISVVSIAICVIVQTFAKDDPPTQEPPQQITDNIQGENITVDGENVSDQLSGT